MYIHIPGHQTRAAQLRNILRGVPVSGRGDGNSASPAAIFGRFTESTVALYATPPLQAREDACTKPVTLVARPGTCATTHVPKKKNRPQGGERRNEYGNGEGRAGAQEPRNLTSCYTGEMEDLKEGASTHPFDPGIVFPLEVRYSSDEHGSSSSSKDNTSDHDSWWDATCVGALLRTFDPGKRFRRSARRGKVVLGVDLSFDRGKEWGRMQHGE